jgi:hypothetical protein
VTPWRLALLCLFLLSCDSDEPASYCEAYCDRALSCSALTAFDGCELRCYADPPVLRDDALSVVAECIYESECQAVLSGDYWKPCVTRAEQGIEPTVDTVEFCEAVAPAAFERGYFYGVSECADDFKLYPKAVLTQLLPCLKTETWDLLNDCFERTFDTL